MRLQPLAHGHTLRSWHRHMLHIAPEAPQRLHKMDGVDTGPH